MKLTIIILILLNLISGCTPQGGFYPTDSECRKVHHQLMFRESDNYSYYQIDLATLKKRARKCNKIESSSRKDYERYKSLDDRVNNLNDRADELLIKSDKLLLED